MAGLRSLVLSAFCLVMGFFFFVMSCTAVAKRNAWPLMSLVLYCFAPVPFFLCGRSADRDDFGGDDDDEPLDAFNAIGLFIGGMLLVSGPGLALVLYHNSVICGSALSLILISGLCFIAAGMSLATSMEDGSNEADDGYNF
ncbi:hypothetical protein JKF63_04695 [Porcisia hertigi]|uniref:Vacuolar protein sorting 55 n=1 Tax=Porcisia hertigi TaxID=2761500 RepID=A0A836ID06_9TRYP|nr:hypothetical protein JKF63_04695 [Porcisia hertigi]